MQLRSADEGSTIFYKVRALRAVAVGTRQKEKVSEMLTELTGGLSWPFL